MKKIPTVFKRDPQDRSRVLPVVHEDCRWVLDGEGRATRKYDGTCVMFDGKRWWARREIKPGKATPADFQPVAHDEVTGKTTGWEPVENSGFAKWHAEALGGQATYVPGTYELIGPKVQGNPEQTHTHVLVPHADAEDLPQDDRSFDGLRLAVTELALTWGIEGIVFHHPDGRMAKIKARDFGVKPVLGGDLR